MGSRDARQMVEIAHSSPGRTRLRVAWLPGARERREQDAVAALADAIARIPGVRTVEVRAATGSVLCVHEECLTLARLTEGVEAAAIAAAPAYHPAAKGACAPAGLAQGARAKIARELAALMRDANDRLLAITEGRVDQATLASLGLLSAGAARIVSDRRVTFPRWSDLGVVGDPDLHQLRTATRTRRAHLNSIVSEGKFVETHRAHIYEKPGVRSTADVVLAASMLITRLVRQRLFT